MIGALTVIGSEGTAPMSHEPVTVWERTVGWVRLGVVASIVAAVVATVLEAAGRTTINPFNLFGYFTVQSNLLLGAVLAVLGGAAAAGRRAPGWTAPVRAACVTYIALVGLVYAVLLAPLGAAGGVPVAWANTVLHVVTPIYGVLDWALAPDRRPLPRSTIGVILVYPVVWLAVVLVRGATDGWVPYPFLDPTKGYASIAVTVVAIAAVVALGGTVVVASSRRVPVGRGARKPQLDG
jgi:hypothetical protein